MRALQILKVLKALICVCTISLLTLMLHSSVPGLWFVVSPNPSDIFEDSSARMETSHPYPSQSLPVSVSSTTPVFHGSSNQQFSAPVSFLPTEATVNPHDFKYLLNEENVCLKHKRDLFLLTFIHTAPQNYKRRMLIRETWGNSQLYPQVKNVVLFAVGRASDNETNQALRLESERYHDIIQEDFIDSYKNLTHKAILWLKWASIYCPNALYLIKVDDDILINVFNLAKHLQNLYKRRIADKRSILCLVWDGMPVMRQPESKWYISKAEYPNDEFGIYCSGSAYIISMDLIYPMYEASKRTKFFWVDDFYATGLLPKDLNVTYTNLRSLYVLSSADVESKLVDSYSLFGHMPGSISKRYAIWKRILQSRGLSFPMP